MQVFRMEAEFGIYIGEECIYHRFEVLRIPVMLASIVFGALLQEVRQAGKLLFFEEITSGVVRSISIGVELG